VRPNSDSRYFTAALLSILLGQCKEESRIGWPNPPFLTKLREYCETELIYKYCPVPCETAAENGGSGGCFRRRPRRFRLLRQALTVLSLHMQAASLSESRILPNPHAHVTPRRLCSAQLRPGSAFGSGLLTLLTHRGAVKTHLITIVNF
jgi:hypothetical protein